MKIVLPIDGGGIRGVVPARILAWFESKLGPVSQWADLIVGTSTGGILAAGLVHTTDGKTPTYSADALLGLYRDDGAIIFKREWYEPAALLHVKFPAAGIESVLQKYYGSVKLSAALTPVLITAFDQLKWTPRLYKSSKAKLDPSEDAMLWEAARATSAAPTYFPNFHGLLDGGVLGATNPSMIALIEALMMWPGEELFLLSIGTGKKDSSIDTAKSTQWGELAYLSSLIDILLDAPERTVEKMTEELLPPERRARIQGTFVGNVPNHAMDDASSANIQALVAFADKIISDNQDFLNGTVKQISNKLSQSKP